MCGAKEPYFVIAYRALMESEQNLIIKALLYDKITPELFV